MPRSRWPTRMSTCSWWTSRRVWSFTPPAGMPAGRSPRRWRDERRAERSRGGPGIVHRLDRDTSGSARGGQERGGPPRAQGAARPAPTEARVPGPRRRPSRGPHGNDRRADRTRPARPAARSRSTPTTRAPPGPTSRSSGCCRRPRCCGSVSRPGAPTRSASTWPPSATRCAATRCTAQPGATAWSGSSFTPTA